MKIKLLRIIIFIILLGVFIQVSGVMKTIFSPSTVRAFGDLTADFHVPLGTPIFTITNAKPGDSDNHPVDIHNGATVARRVAVKGKWVDGVGISPAIEHVLSLVIKEGTENVYTGTVEEFLNKSTLYPDGVEIGTVAAGGDETYDFEIGFPSSAGDEYQGKSVKFDLTFGTVAADHIVINEVYAWPDAAHGIDGVRLPDKAKSNNGGQSDEWIELYNPTNSDVSLKNWTLATSHGSIKINANKIIPAGGFAVVAKDASTWRYWNIPAGVLKVELGNWFPLGFDNGIDHVALVNPAATTIDEIYWGSSPLIFSSGKSLERIVPGYDTNAASDWNIILPPTPGK